MAALTSIAVTNAQPGSATLSLNGSSYDLNGSQVAQLAQVVKRLTVECGAGSPSQPGATVTLPSRF